MEATRVPCPCISLASKVLVHCPANLLGDALKSIEAAGLDGDNIELQVQASIILAASGDEGMHEQDVVHLQYATGTKGDIGMDNGMNEAEQLGDPPVQARKEVGAAPEELDKWSSADLLQQMEAIAPAEFPQLDNDTNKADKAANDDTSAASTSESVVAKDGATDDESATSFVDEAGEEVDDEHGDFVDDTEWENDDSDFVDDRTWSRAKNAAVVGVRDDAIWPDAIWGIDEAPTSGELPKRNPDSGPSMVELYTARLHDLMAQGKISTVDVTNMISVVASVPLEAREHVATTLLAALANEQRD